MRKSSVLLVLGVAFVMACQPPEMTRSDAMQYQRQVEARVELWARLMNNGKGDSVLAMYHQVPDLLVIRPTGAVSRGFEEEGRALEDFFKGIQYMNLVLQSPTTQVLGSRAAVTTFGHSTDIIGSEGRRRPVTAGRGTIIWVRDRSDDVWKIHLLQLSANAPLTN